jgi:hypothetical protein
MSKQLPNDTSSAAPELESTMEQIANAKVGMTSEEAGALIVSGGRTKDVEEAEIIAAGQTLQLDALQRAHLRRAMGFDFKLKVAPNKIHLYSETGPHVSAHCKLREGDLDTYGNIINQEVIENIVSACLVLKQRWDAAVQKRGEKLPA